MKRQLFRAAAAVCVASSMAIGLWQPSAGSSPNQASSVERAEAGYWVRAFPFQADTVEGQSTTRPVLFRSTRQVPVPTTLPSPQSPPTTAPLPVPFPTVPPPPVTTPDPGGGFSNPGVPEGGFWVANDPTGAYAVSALRFRGDIGSARLNIFFAAGSSSPGPVVACPTLSDWKPQVGGAWNDRPAHDCDRLELSGKLNAEGNGIQFEIPSDLTTFGEQELSLMILPNRDAGDVFSLIFQPPTVDSLEVFGGQPLPETEPPTTTTTISGAPPTTQARFEPTPTTSFSSPTSSFDGTTPTSAFVDEVAAPPVAAPSSGGNVAEQLVDLFEDDPIARYASMGLLLAMGAGFFLFGNQEAREPRLLGGLAAGAAASGGAPVSSRVAASPARGIGRFSRPRDSKPGKL